VCGEESREEGRAGGEGADGRVTKGGEAVEEEEPFGHHAKAASESGVGDFVARQVGSFERVREHKGLA
jgi:hypothetical protein